MKVLILGGNGFIGSAVVARLCAGGHSVSALARSTARASRRMPAAKWLRADIAALSRPGDWTPLLAGVDVVVNCAGALQDGARDNVVALQQMAMLALYEAASVAAITLIVQISARTDGAAANTAFLSTKANADAALTACGVPFVILRPAIVVGRNAHGGSALLRALAAVPLVTPLVRGDAPLQFAALEDLAEIVAEAVSGAIGPGADLDVAAPMPMTLLDAVARHREWLGLPPARPVAVPAAGARLVSAMADLLGELGWRSPLRSTAMAAAAGGVTVMRARTPGRPLRSLDEILAGAPSGVQDVWFARLYVMKPVIIAALGVFWLLSGTVALLRYGVSSNHLQAAGLPQVAAQGLTLLTSLADIALGLGVAVRATARASLQGMIALSVCYLVGATILQPALWADPLGPLVKVLPSIVLALVALAILDER